MHRDLWHREAVLAAVHRSNLKSTHQFCKHTILYLVSAPNLGMMLVVGELVQETVVEVVKNSSGSSLILLIENFLLYLYR
jgi:hypothetical protein